MKVDMEKVAELAREKQGVIICDSCRREMSFDRLVFTGVIYRCRCGLLKLAKYDKERAE